MKQVVIGSCTKHDYASFLPLVGFAWREAIGYEPTFLLIGSYEDWKRDRHGTLVPDTLRANGFPVLHVDRETGIEDGTMAQSIRQFASALPFHEQDLMIPSDADLIPVNRDFYHQHEPSEKAIAIYYSNAYDDEPKPHFATCHVSMTVAVWREVMLIGGPGSPRMEMLKSFQRRDLAKRIKMKEADPAKNWGHVWFEDQWATSDNIVASKYWKGGIQFIPREGKPPRDRLDRAHWPANYDPANYTDCHSIRPMWSDVNWPRLLPLIKYLVPQRVDVLTRYRDAFREAMGCPG